MAAIKAIAIAFSTFSRIPMPRFEWTESNMRYMMCAFPLVGVAVALLCAGWWGLCALLGFGGFLRAVGLALLPLLVTGGIHMDGFADVVDAVSSYAPAEKKRQILKDPHIGSFAAIGIAGYLFAYAGFASELDTSLQTLALLSCIPVASRLCSSVATICLKGNSSTGMLASFRQAGEGSRVVLGVLAAEALACLILAALFSFVFSGIILACCVVVFALTWRLSERQFGGFSGDLAGFLLQLCELAMLICLVLAVKLVIL